MKRAIFDHETSDQDRNKCLSRAYAAETWRLAMAIIHTIQMDRPKAVAGDQNV
jgi:hypothetical protein